MKNKVLLISASVLLFIFLVFGTYSWYTFFLRAGGDFDINNNNNLKDGNIVFSDNGNSVYENNANSVTDSEIDSVTPYKFQVKNTGDKETTYNLYIEDLPVNAINDGCTAETLLTRNQLKYQLKLNGKVLKEDYLSNINDNIIHQETLTGNTINNYELRIFIPDDASEWAGKHYHYKINVSKS